MNMFKIGCHLSASKGFLAMGKTAVSIGANTFQFAGIFDIIGHLLLSINIVNADSNAFVHKLINLKCIFNK